MNTDTISPEDQNDMSNDGDPETSTEVEESSDSYVMTGPPAPKETAPDIADPGDEFMDTGTESSSDPEQDPNDQESTQVSPDFSIIGNIPVLLTLEVGDREMTISELSSLQAGSIVALMHKEDEPLDVRANGVLIAKGEVVLAGDNYGVRILSLTAPLPDEAIVKP